MKAMEEKRCGTCQHFPEDSRGVSRCDVARTTVSEENYCHFWEKRETATNEESQADDDISKKKDGKRKGTGRS